MSSHRAMTLSMQSLNKLYFQFFEKYILPNLSKQLNQITQLMRQKTAYEVHRYLEETLAAPSDNYSSHANSSLSSPPGSLNNLASPIPPNSYAYQYPLSSQSDHPKNIYTDTPLTFDKNAEKQLQDSASFKNKLGMRRVHTGLAFQDQPRPYDPYEYNKHNTMDDNHITVPSISANHLGNDTLINIPTLTTDFKVEFAYSKEPVQNKKSKIMKEQVRKISKVFNEGHSKIDKFSKNGSEAQNKLFNLNISTKLEKREEAIWMKDYPYQQKQELHSWKL